MRLDLALCRLRIARTRSLARALIEAGHLRINGERAVQPSRAIAPGDVLTIPRRLDVLVIEILTLPMRRGPPAEAQSCYRVLDPKEQSALAEGSRTVFKGNHAP
ncbi:MAG: RNA-binding S4 domain-containing protein [Erythrobacter sp.]|jgi:ribosome-associated heat shock protein Hsp15|nr:RNA-binding S4 domain-containing protein [Erythrobacter sp.]RZV36090.1 MAG: RNA-binding S4 domain-containing protein [Sphingomonadaceae bacterium]